MRRHSNLEHNEIFFLAGIIGAQVTYFEKGFRQRDLKFMIDMFSNWVDLLLPDRSLLLHNAQIMRYLNALCKEGHAKQVSKTSQPRYKLTPAGLVEVTSRLVHRKPCFPIENFYFVLHVVDAYRPQFEALLEAESSRFPTGIRMEMETLLDVRKPLRSYIDFVQFELKKLQSRIHDSKEVLQIIREGRQKKKITRDIVEEIETKFPYDLNSQKSLSRFYSELEGPVSDWILDVGLKKRTEQIWFPLEKVLDVNLQLLKQLEIRLNTKQT